MQVNKLRVFQSSPSYNFRYYTKQNECSAVSVENKKVKYYLPHKTVTKPKGGIKSFYVFLIYFEFSPPETL